MRGVIEITNFTSGELSPRMKGRTDHKSYFNGCETALNMIVMPQGGITATPGTVFAGLNKNQAAKPRLVEFIYSTLQAYVLEFSDQAIRVYMNGGPVKDGESFVDITVPYHTADLDELSFAQSADTLFITHTAYPPATLTRSSHTAWTYSALSFSDGPYLEENTTSNAVTPSGKSGSITLAWDSTTGINGGAGFTSDDVGRSVRVMLYSAWAWCRITAVSNDKTVTATVQGKVKDGAQGYVDGANWTASTRYEKGTVVRNSTTHGGVEVSNYYIASTGGISAPTLGPLGNGKAIMDGSIIWSALTGLNATGYEGATWYEVDDIVFQGTNYYQAENPGKSNSGGGLTGTTEYQDNGAVTIWWRYLQQFELPAKTEHWCLGAWCKKNGYPRCVRFFQQRLCFAGVPAFPNRIMGSQTGDFTNMAPTTADGTIKASSAIDWTIDDDQVNAVHWLINAGSAQSMQLGLGSLSGEHVLQAASSSEALSPTSVQAYSETAYGSAPNVQPVRIGKAVLFVDRSGRKLREWAFFWQANGYLGPDKLQLSEHISRSGLAQLVYQASPHQVVWARRKDGILVAITYDRDQDIWAPTRQRLGGNYYGGNPVVESLAVIPSPDGTYDQLWLAVLRTIDGAEVRTIEVLAPYFDDMPADTAFFSDCGLASDLVPPAAKLSIAGLVNKAQATQADAFGGTATLSTDADVFSAAGSIVRVNGGKLQISTVTNARQATAQVLTPLKSVAPAASGTWSCTPLHQSFSGLDHLEGETVLVWGDGADLGSFTVTDGAVSLNEKVSYAVIGLEKQPVLVTMPWEPATGQPSSLQGRAKRIDHVAARFHETRGAMFGRRVTDPITGVVNDKLEAMRDRQAADLMDNAPPLFSGMRRIAPLGGADLEGQLVFTRKGAGPMTIIGLFAEGDVSEVAP